MKFNKALLEYYGVDPARVPDFIEFWALYATSFYERLFGKMDDLKEMKEAYLEYLKNPKLGPRGKEALTFFYNLRKDELEDPTYWDRVGSRSLNDTIKNENKREPVKAKFVNESLNDFKEIKIYMMGDTSREMFVFIVVDGEGIGGQYSGISPISGEKQFASMKIGISDKYKGKGYGTLLYLSTLSLLGNKGLSPHRKKDSTKPDAIKIWKKLDDKNFIQRVDLDKKLYKDNEILNSKYILTDKSTRNKYIKKIKKISNDAFDRSNKYANQSWKIVNEHMD